MGARNGRNMGLRDRFSRKKDAPVEGEVAAGTGEAVPAVDEMPTIVQGAPVPGPDVPEDQTFIAPPQEPAPDAGIEGAAAAHGTPGQLDPNPHAQATGEAAAEIPAPQQPAAPARPGFRERGRLRRRLRYLREVRELGYRDLGGLVLDQHRFQRPNEELVAGKVEAIEALDREMRAIEQALSESTPYTELFIPGLSACPRCGALHGSDARFCPQCGLSFKGPRTIAGVGTPDGAPGAAGYPASSPAPVFGTQGATGFPGAAAYPESPQPAAYPPAPQAPVAPEPAQETEVQPPPPQPPSP